MVTALYTVAGVLILCQVAYSQAANKKRQCLQCERVAKPEDCLNRIRCAENEECFTERYVTDQGHVFYDLGCKVKKTCQLSGYEVSQAQLKQRQAALAAGKRQLGEPMAAHVCEECCDFDHCNDLLCGGHQSTLLKCVSCIDMKDMENCEKIRACPGTQMCFVQERITDQFELLFDSGCMRHIQCDAYFKIQAQSSGGFYDPCFNCCNDTFCNSRCLAPGATTSMPVGVSTQMPGSPGVSTRLTPQTTRFQTTPRPAVSSANVPMPGTSAPAVPQPSVAGGTTPPPFVG